MEIDEQKQIEINFADHIFLMKWRECRVDEPNKKTKLFQSSPFHTIFFKKRPKKQ